MSVKQNAPRTRRGAHRGQSIRGSSIPLTTRNIARLEARCCIDGGAVVAVQKGAFAMARTVRVRPYVRRTPGCRRVVVHMHYRRRPRR